MFDFIKTNCRIEKIGKLILELIEYDNSSYEIKVKGENIFITFNKDEAIDYFEEKRYKLFRENILNSLEN